MARFIRLYDSPGETPGDVLGFSSGIASAAYDPTLHRWLANRDYTVTAESEQQKKACIILGGMTIRTSNYFEVDGIPIPPETVSSGHLLVEPPLSNSDIGDLGRLLPTLPAIDDGGLRQHYFINSRSSTQTPSVGHGDVLASWPQHTETVA